MANLKIVSGADLVTLINNGQSNAFAQFYTAYFQKLILVSDSYVKDLSTAEEIVQDIFLKLWENPDNLETVNLLKPYLYRSVINASINYLNRQKSIERHHEKIASEFSEEYLLELDDENELIVFLRKEIEKLPVKCQRVFKLNRFDGLKYKEIADQLNISERTVENHLANALKTLREAMQRKNNHLNRSKTFFIFMQLYLF